MGSFRSSWTLVNLPDAPNEKGGNPLAIVEVLTTLVLVDVVVISQPA